MKTITRQWLDSARTDIKCCENNLHDEFVTNIVAFHAQQVVEKSFKAIIEENGFSVPHVHNLVRLHSIAEPLITFSVELETLESLDGIYTSSRYPSDFGMLSSGKPTINEARELYEKCKEIFEELEKDLS